MRIQDFSKLIEPAVGAMAVSSAAPYSPVSPGITGLLAAMALIALGRPGAAAGAIGYATPLIVEGLMGPGQAAPEAKE